MSATYGTQSAVPQGPVFCMAMELSLATWKLVFTVGPCRNPGSARFPPVRCFASSPRSIWPISDSGFPKQPP